MKLERVPDVDAAAGQRRQLEYPIGSVPRTGAAVRIHEDLMWIRMPLPMKLDHINLWLMRDGLDWAVVDCGIHSQATQDAWNGLFDAGGLFQGSRVSRVLATHMHPDHIGMAGFLTGRHACELWMTRLEYLCCRGLISDSGHPAPPEAVDFYRRAGWDEQQVEQYRAGFGSLGKMIREFPATYRRMKQGDVMVIGNHEWTVVHGDGHSPEHACLYCAELGLFISGDQVLPSISSNVSVMPMEPDADSMADWLSSLARLKREVPDTVLVLPSHNEPFYGLHARLDQLLEKQYALLDKLRASLQSAKRVIDLFDVLFPRPISMGMAPFTLELATGEAIAYLNYLYHRGEVERTIAPDGIAWYSAVPPTDM